MEMKILELGKRNKKKDRLGKRAHERKMPPNNDGWGSQKEKGTIRAHLILGRVFK